MGEQFQDLLKLVRTMREAQKKVRLSGPASSVHSANLWQNKVDWFLDQHPEPQQPAQGKIEFQ
ncbi:hypothetical protein [Spirosoma rigui]|uniref:hypothetical protein n=1 Tax=Spirosoma rigui TaxID=564064 RepID=UPI0009AFE207|nr:hypothetical protein [Spirosoma rigui]